MHRVTPPIICGRDVPILLYLRPSEEGLLGVLRLGVLADDGLSLGLVEERAQLDMALVEVVVGERAIGVELSFVYA